MEELLLVVGSIKRSDNSLFFLHLALHWHLYVRHSLCNGCKVHVGSAL